MGNPIDLRPLKEPKIVKQIFIVSKFHYGEDSIGFILYERPLSLQYAFLKKEEQNKFGQYPEQKDYPSDVLDELILASVQNSYPKSYVRNHLLLFSNDQENIKLLKGRPNDISHLILTPSISVVDLSIAGRNFYRIEKEMKVYADSTKDKIKNLSFSGKYDLQREQDALYIQDKIKFI